VVLVVICQLIVLAIMNYLTYRPYGQLMTVLQSKGFIKPGDRPTFKMVMIYYIERPRVWWKAFCDWWQRKDSSSKVTPDEDTGAISARSPNGSETQGAASARASPPPSARVLSPAVDNQQSSKLGSAVVAKAS